MADFFYLDCDPLMHWAESRVKPDVARSLAIGRFVDDLFANDQVEIQCSEYTLLEWHNGIYKHWRDTAGAHKQHDQKWATTVVLALMEQIARGRLTVMTSPPKAVEKATMFVLLATRDHARNFRIYDALHLVCAAEWAGSMKEVVKLVTSDDGFWDFVGLYPEFGDRVALVNPDPQSSPPAA